MDINFEVMNKILRFTLLLLFNFAFYIPFAKSQIILEQELLDSILSITVEYYSDFNPENPIYPNYPAVIKLSEAKNSSNTIFTSSTWISARVDIPKGSFIYLQNQKVHFLILDNAPIDFNLQSKLISPGTSMYQQILDSIQVPYRPKNGIITSRGKLIVYSIKRRIFSKKYFVITSQPFIPYTSAPKQFQPVIDFSDEISSDIISSFYYDSRLRLKQEYYNDLKPIKPVRFKLTRKNK